jgi:hypothetical protein
VTLLSIHREMRARRVFVFDKSISWHQRLFAAVLFVLSLGLARHYLTHVVTTIGRRIYVPRAWGSWPSARRAEILRHELVHVRQFERWGPLMLIAYLLLPLPLGLAWCRMRIEREAYEESIRATWEAGGRDATDALREHVVGQFSGATYLWMWPFRRSTERWYDTFVETLEALEGHVPGLEVF